MEIVIKILVYAITAILILSLFGFYLILRPFRIISTDTPKQFGVDYEDVTFRTEDGITLKGWFVPNSNPHAKTIIVLHGYPADKGDILLTRLFLHKDYNLLFFDFRYLGASGGYYSSVGYYEARDIRAALAYLHRRGIHQVAVWGLSMGGAAALLTAKNASEIKAMIAETPYARLDWMANSRYPIPGLNYVLGGLLRLWGYVFLRIDVTTVRPMDDAAAIKIPLLLLYSKDDELIKYQHALGMQEAVKHNPKVEIVIYEGKKHAQPADNYQELVKKFLDNNFPPH